MKTESAPAKPSSVARFLGEAGAPEAQVKVEVTGTPATVQRAISKLAKKPIKKSIAATSAPEAPAEPEAREIEDEVTDKAVDVVEALIKEGAPRAQ